MCGDEPIPSELPSATKSARRFEILTSDVFDDRSLIYLVTTGRFPQSVFILDLYNLELFDAEVNALAAPLVPLRESDPTARIFPLDYMSGLRRVASVRCRWGARCFRV